MKNKKNTIIITLSAVITSALGILFTFNKVIEKLATSKNLLAEHHHETYHWRFGDIAYRITGEGHPIFLIHDLESGSSSVEWSSIIQKLSKQIPYMQWICSAADYRNIPELLIQTIFIHS